MTNGTWTDQAITFRGSGTSANPITLRAETPGKVLLTGSSSLTVAGEYLVVSGLWLKAERGAKDGVALTGQHCRLTETAVTDSAYRVFVHFSGRENRMDHCYLAGKTSEAPTLQIEVEDQPNHHRIDSNHFGYRPPLGRNGGETIRLGYSHQSMKASGTLVEQNLFDRCDGELEIISNKSCENIYRFNTFSDCAGMFTLRHGNRCVVDGNVFLGNHKKGSGGIRVIGEDHTVINNYIDGVENGAFWITSGIPDSPLKGYFQAKNCLIAFNTVVDSRGPALTLDAGFGTSDRSIRPANITIVNNLFSMPTGEALLKGQEGNGFRWMGNITTANLQSDHAGIRTVDPKLAQGSDRLWRPETDSPVRGSAEGEFAAIKTDLDGQPRTGRFDVGCDQLSQAPVLHRPLSAVDVGPSWMTEAERNSRP